MRPLRVTMQAFGPFATEQVLDFADLRGAGFFLITGPTGAGKTTVLDAMSFALYGVTSGGPENEGGRSGASMRSDHADPELLTRVTFDFALGEDRYRIVREPQQERPKARGEGTTAHLQKATLWRLRDEATGNATAAGDASAGPDRDGRPLATTWTGVSAEAERLLGFRSEQFRQVVMLPQGRFQKLLESDSKERESILRALFDTGHYTAIELSLKDEAAALRKQDEAISIRRQETLGQAEADTEDDLQERRARLAIEAAEAAAGATRAEAARDQAQALLLAGRDAAARLNELAAAQKACATVAGGTIEADRLRGVHADAVRAAGLADASRRSATAAADLATRRAAAHKAESAGTLCAGESLAAAEVCRLQDGRAPERDAAQAEVLRLKALVGAAEALAQARQAAGRAAEGAGECAKAAEAADAGWRTATERASRAEQAWSEAQAGLLARALHEGGPCPVCGSREHPAPAPLADDAPEAERVEELRLLAARLLAARDETAAARAAAEATLAAAKATVAEREAGAPSGLEDPAALAAAITAAGQHAVALAEAHRAAVDGARAAEAAAAAAASLAQTTAQELARAEGEAAQAHAELVERLTAAGFADEATLAAAAREPAEIERLRALVEAHDQAVIETAERLRLASAAAHEVTAPDLAALDEAASMAAEIARAQQEAAAGLTSAAAAAGRHLERLAELATQAEALGERYRVLGYLAEVANGGNPRHLSFQRYVLGAFLDDVLVAASQRLRVMTKGRYRLERTDRRFGGRAAAGLNLEVYDAWTGVARPVATLSGGETFMAALSLALGLAEVVQAHAGGIRLETVFVDEGFGSLDDESLDLAVATLMSLNEDGGRLVGIISHVSELRERIDARLEVAAGTRGSTARFVVP